jgi:hypothetical protein
MGWGGWILLSLVLDKAFCCWVIVGCCWMIVGCHKGKWDTGVSGPFCCAWELL